MDGVIIGPCGGCGLLLKWLLTAMVDTKQVRNLFLPVHACCCMSQELDEETLKALSSETRREILKLLKGRTRTPTYLSKEVGRHKSTVSEHLDRLVDAGLVERNDVEGRRRVTYGLTRKGRQSISSSRLQLVLTASVASLAGGLVAGVGSLTGQRSYQQAATMEAMDSGATATTAEGVAGMDPLLVAGIVLSVLGVVGLAYWYRSL